jgi:hypothetical protein
MTSSLATGTAVCDLPDGPPSRFCVQPCLKEIFRFKYSASLHSYRAGKNRFIVRRHERGDNLSVRFDIQNSISLTIAVLPRII